MSVFVAKILTLLGYVLYAGGPFDAVQLAMNGSGEVQVAHMHAAAPQGVECVAGCDSATVAWAIAGPVRMARLVIPEEAKMPVLRSSTIDFAGEIAGDFPPSDMGAFPLESPVAEPVGVVE